MSFNLGVNVVEVDGRAAPAIPAAALSVAGLLVNSQRGVPDLAVRIGGVLDYINNFGGYTGTSFGLHAVRGFFENGGTEAYAVRIVGPGAVAARVDIRDRAGVPLPTLRVEAGSRGRLDPGAWGNSLALTVRDHPRGTSFVPAQVRGSTIEPFAVAAGGTLLFNVNGNATPITVTFGAADFATAGAATAVEVARAINRATTAVRASATADRRVLVASATPGPRARLVIAGTAAGTLGFTAGTANTDAALANGTDVVMIQATGGFLPTSSIRLESRGNVTASTALSAAIPGPIGGINVAVDGGAGVDITFTAADFAGGLATPTPDEAVIAIGRQASGFTASLDHQNRVVLLSNRYGPGSSIAVAAPVTAGVVSALTVLGLAAPVVVAGSRRFATVGTLDESGRLMTLVPALGAAMPANASRIQSVEFDLIVGREGAEVERWEAVSMQPGLPYSAPAVVNDPLAGSRYLVITDLGSASLAGEDAPAELRDGAGNIIAYSIGSTTPGAEPNPPGDTRFIGDPAARTGLFAFDTVAIQLLAVPESTSLGIANACLSYCENRGDMMFVGSVPAGVDLQGAKTYATALRGRKVYGALYGPWIGIANPLDTDGSNPVIRVPPAGHVMGVYARIADVRGIWKAPAGEEAQIRGALAVDFPTTDAEHTDLVKNGGVNTIRFIPGAGVVVDASRTLSTDPRWLYVGTRRLFNFVKASLRDGLRWVAQEPHSEELRRMVRFNVITPFLLGLWRRGAFGSDPAEAVFTVKCDAENNPPAEVQLGNFRVEVYFYPVRPAETIVIVVGQQDSGAAAAEA